MDRCCSRHQDSIKILIELCDQKLVRIQLMVERTVKVLFSKYLKPCKLHLEVNLGKHQETIHENKDCDSFIALEVMVTSNWLHRTLDQSQIDQRTDLNQSIPNWNFQLYLLSQIKALRELLPEGKWCSVLLTPIGMVNLPRWIINIFQTKLEGPLNSSKFLNHTENYTFLIDHFLTVIIYKIVVH